MPDPILASMIDELGALRALTTQLKAREALLRDRILAMRPNGTVSGQTYGLTIHRSTHRRFDRRRLPDEVQADPDYWVERDVTKVKTEPLPAPPEQTDVIERDMHQNRK
ncbi:hypothetical protein [Tropicibacter alexandrii]|uniref:hypothetical protein n=1 Tax=Tropicibacter alexandrii TaxID=2267683 RepID=UPI000EF482F5|nr:hypothetical protein [Tropicibacter alexandrii]